MYTIYFYNQIINISNKLLNQPQPVLCTQHRRSLPKFISKGSNRWRLHQAVILIGRVLHRVLHLALFHRINWNFLAKNTRLLYLPNHMKPRFNVHPRLLCRKSVTNNESIVNYFQMKLETIGANLPPRRFSRWHIMEEFFPNMDSSTEKLRCPQYDMKRF